MLAYTATTATLWDLHGARASGDRQAELLDRYRRRFCLEVLRLFGVRWHVAPQTLPPQRATGRIVVANHRSVLDIPILVALFGGTVLSRADVAEWPVLGGLAKRAGTLFVDRSSKTSGAAAIRSMRQRLARGDTLVVFPEGGTHRGDEVRSFRGGAFVAARALDVEIVPVGLAHEPGAEYVDVDFRTHLRSIAERAESHVEVRVGAPFAAEGNARSLSERAQRAVQELVTDARAAASGHRRGATARRSAL
jgi:1-acyl-sn-glycerol-3-phosphate acyltransferase